MSGPEPIAKASNSYCAVRCCSIPALRSVAFCFFRCDVPTFLTLGWDANTRGCTFSESRIRGLTCWIESCRHFNQPRGCTYIVGCWLFVARAGINQQLAIPSFIPLPQVHPRHDALPPPPPLRLPGHSPVSIQTTTHRPRPRHQPSLGRRRN